MQVETFECNETAHEPIEASEEAIGIIESLELEGQRQLIKPGDDESPQSRCPYRVMTAEEVFVYGMLCPQKWSLAEYSASPIPLRVLQVAAHAKSLGLFAKFEVWDRQSSEVTDPVLVAYDGEQTYLLTTRRFILARWGDVLEAFSTLLRQSIELKRSQLKEMAAKIPAKLESLTDANIIAGGVSGEIDLDYAYKR